MASKRMFSLDVVGTDKFLDLPISAQCLYFHLGMRADDDGFISSPKQIIKMTTATTGDLKVLVESGYIIPFESGIIVVRHWRQNNYLRRDRYTKSSHTEELAQLSLTDNVYSLGAPTGIPCGLPVGDADKIRLDKNRIDNNIKNIIICPEPDKSAPDNSGIMMPLNDKTFYDVPLKKINLWKETYPAVDVENELKRMVAWLDSNPTRRKTKRGITKFINSWLARQQDKGVVHRNGCWQQERMEPESGKREYSPAYQEMYKDLAENKNTGQEDPFRQEHC